MLFLTEQDVQAALSGADAYKEAVAVIERVLAAAIRRHHAPSQAHHGDASEVSRAPLAQYSHAARHGAGPRRRGRAFVFGLSGHQPLRDHLPVRLGRHEDVGDHLGLPSARDPHRGALRRGGEISGAHGCRTRSGLSAAAVMHAAWFRRSAPCGRSNGFRSTAAIRQCAEASATTCTRRSASRSSPVRRAARRCAMPTS